MISPQKKMAKKRGWHSLRSPPPHDCPPGFLLSFPFHPTTGRHHLRFVSSRKTPNSQNHPSTHDVLISSGVPEKKHEDSSQKCSCKTSTSFKRILECAFVGYLCFPTLLRSYVLAQRQRARTEFHTGVQRPTGRLSTCQHPYQRYQPGRSQRCRELLTRLRCLFGVSALPRVHPQFARGIFEHQIGSARSHPVQPGWMSGPGR
jgi:hypothetical protein